MLFFQISGEEERFLFFIGMIYELIVLIIAGIFLVLIVIKYIEKKHELTRYLLFIFIVFTSAIFFSLLSKIFVVVRLDLVVDPYSPLGWIFFRILSFRVSEFLVTIAIFLSYNFKVKIFQKDYKKNQRYIVIIFGTFTAFYNLIVYSPDSSSLAVLLDAVAFLLTFVFMTMIYVVFMYRMFEAYRGVDVVAYKNAFLSLAIMSICYMLIFLNLLLDRIYILLFNIPGFTVFYYLAWAFALLGFLCGYLGYIRPQTGQLK